MARSIDSSKIERIKQATIDVVVTDGIKNASVSKIAKMANVSSGYLYRFYSGKDELIQTIFSELFEEITQLFKKLIKEKSSVKTIIETFLTTLFDSCNTNPNNALFILKSMTDYSFKINEKEKQTLNKISDDILQLGSKTKEIRPEINKELLHTLLVGASYFFMNIRLRQVFESQLLNKEDIQKITKLYTQALA